MRPPPGRPGAHQPPMMCQLAPAMGTAQTWLPADAAPTAGRAFPTVWAPAMSQRAEDGADAHRVQGAPLPVAIGAGDSSDLVVDVVLGVAVAAGALQPGGDDQPGGLEPARLAAVDAGAVVAGAGDPGPGLQVVQRSPVGPVQHLLELLLPSGPVRGGLAVSGLAGPA